MQSKNAVHRKCRVLLYLMQQGSYRFNALRKIVFFVGGAVNAKLGYCKLYIVNASVIHEKRKRIFLFIPKPLQLLGRPLCVFIAFICPLAFVKQCPCLVAGAFYIEQAVYIRRYNKNQQYARTY